MADEWYYAQSGERKGPVSFAKLQELAKSGWLTPGDLVWRHGMPDWTPAKDVEGLFATALGQRLRKTIDGLRHASDGEPAETTENPTPPGIPEESPKPKNRPRPPRPKPVEVNWTDLKPRHVVAGCGGFLAALGIAFTAIAQSRLGLAFTLGGLVLAAAGFYAEIGNLLGQAIENLAQASTEAAERRLRAKELALEKRRLDLEEARIAQARAGQDAPATVLANQPTGGLQQVSGLPGQIVVINQPPVKRWSPGLAAVLSFFLPGLGQLYKGQVINGLVWFFRVMCGYAALILPGLVLHFFCVLGALSGNPWTEGKTTVAKQ